MAGPSLPLWRRSTPAEEQRATKEDGRGQSVLTSHSHTVKLLSITAMFDYHGINDSPNYGPMTTRCHDKTRHDDH